MAPIATLVESRAGETIATGRITTKFEIQMNAHVPYPVAIHATVKLVSGHTSTKSALGLSSWEKDEDHKSNRHRLKHCTRFHSHYWRQGKDGKRWPPSVNWKRQTSVPLALNSILTHPTTIIKKNHCAKHDGSGYYVRITISSMKIWNITPTTSLIYHSSTVTMSLLTSHNGYKECKCNKTPTFQLIRSDIYKTFSFDIQTLMWQKWNLRGRHHVAFCTFSWGSKQLAPWPLA